MLNLEAVGATSAPARRTWTDRDSLLYAVGVGAGSINPTGFELEFTTENSHGIEQRVLPTFSTIICLNALDRSLLGDLDGYTQLHGFENITLFGAIPPSGSMDVTSTIESIHDKGSGALLTLKSTGTDIETKVVLMEVRTGVFIVGAGGFGGTRGSSEDDPTAHVVTERQPDQEITYGTRPDQALTYRLSADRNPLHTDPTFAKQSGFDRPILHGLCTYGFVGRALLHTVCGSDPLRFETMNARFSSPTYPGDELTTKIWDVTGEHERTYRFLVVNQRDEIVMSSGLVRTASTG